MKDKPVNVAASVHDRLLLRSKAEGRPFEEVLLHYAIERFLFRLSRSRHRSGFVLKGALMLRFWGGPSSRSTRDIDLAGVKPASIDGILEIFRQILAVKVEDDGLRFETDSLRGEEIRVDAEYDGVRVKFTSYLEKAMIRLQADIGFGDVITPVAREIVYPSLLGLDEPKLLGSTPETAIAEKFQAMVVLDTANSRMKDFFDLCLLANCRQFEGRVLASAIKATFARRKTALPGVHPSALTPLFFEAPEKQIQWRAFLRKARIIGPQPDLSHAVALIAIFLMPILAAAAKGETFDLRWPPGGPWMTTQK